MEIADMSKDDFIKAVAEIVIDYISKHKASELEEIQERLTVEEASKILGMTPNGVRVCMQKGVFQPPIGHIVCNGSRKEYYVYRSKINKYLGRE